MDEVSQQNIIFLNNRGSFFCQIAPYVDYFIDIHQNVESKAVKITDIKIDFILLRTLDKPCIDNWPTRAEGKFLSPLVFAHIVISNTGYIFFNS